MIAPGLNGLRNYQPSWLRADVIAGVTVAAYLVPQAMAYAQLAGLPAVTGLWAVLGPLAVYVVLGSSRLLSVGPESTTALMTASTVGAVAGGDPKRYVVLASALALMVGVICLVAWLVRLGFLADLLSRPVLVGYLAGIAVLMIAGQLGRMTGTTVEGDSPPAELLNAARQIGTWHLPTVVLSAVVLALLLASAHWKPQLPAPLLVMALAAVVTALAGLDDHGVAVIGTVPSGLPAPMLPGVGLADLRMLILPALGVALVGYTDTVLTGRAFAKHRERIDADAELLALGTANLTAGALQGFPVSSSGSRTAVAAAAGAKSQVYSLVTLAMVILTLLVAGPLLSTFPTAALGALVVYAALRLVDLAEFRRFGRFRRSELILALATCVGVVTLGVLYGVLVAVALSVLDLFRRVARPHDGILGIVPGIAGMHDVDDYPQAHEVPGLVVYRYDSPLFFANAEDFRRRAMAAIDNSPEPVRWLLLNTEANVEIDITAVDALDALREELVGRGIVLALARVKQDLRDDLDAAGFLERLGADRVYMTLPTAVEAFRQEFGQQESRQLKEQHS
ncbi:high affinity sulfate transporter 1 [Kribbella orskensis]|uniref:High affinity sulfate transporter 1 n=1 Tax=Kribbella orskensis TaxID=2512216 RepID=A0ABY2BPA0_9ACTN|nr:MULTISPECIES: SulP family inorganic anion transporter [Kribbella]TCN42215.1 high affinity sulfate transporter 1 [Kribbella sp. VKM Ac-2500]TCO26093.1 high affinity sulfate transporter 1 [Kribbella orskensis]